MADEYITGAQVRELTEFPYVAGKTDEQLAFYAQRAHLAVRDYGPFPTFDSLAGDPELLAQFKADMKVAVFLVAENLALAGPAKPMEAAGITQQTMTQTSVSRAQGGGAASKTEPSRAVPPEAERILKHWASTTIYEPIRTTVFPETSWRESGNENHKVFTNEDAVGILTPSPDQ